MTKIECIYENQWGSILDRPEAGFVELRWFDTTADMTGDDFKEMLKSLASAQGHPGRGVLVDSTAFRMDTKHMNGEWRDANIIPRYNAARVRKFAFHMPQGMPAIGRAPAKEGPGEFLTSYYGTRRDALAWLAQ